MNEFDWKGQYGEICCSHATPMRRPIIGITGNYGDKGCELAKGYYQSVYEAGGTAFVIPPIEGQNDLYSILEQVDGLIFSGGGDLNPLFMGAEPSPALHGICAQRDRKELLLLQMALDRQIPMLCICRGIQLLGLVTGGTIIQDLGSEKSFEGKLIKHSQDLDRGYASHSVYLAEDSLLRKIFNQDVLAVNSFHHQAVGNVGQPLRVSAQSCDGVIEAVESAEFKSVIGVQWHPEGFIVRGDNCMIPLFKWLANEAQNFSDAKLLHSRVLTLDTHCDTPMFFNKGIRFDERDSKILVDLHKMREGHLDASIMVAYLPQKGLDDVSLKAATTYCDHLLDGVENIIGGCSGVGMATSPGDLYRLKQEGKKGIMRGIENGYAIGKDLKNVERYRHRGVVYMTLCHNGDNLICDSAKGSTCLNNGVSEFGEKVILEMNNVGMMVDLSHGGEQSFWNALEISRLPIVCTHSSCRAICNHPRNLTDDQLKALAAAGGVCQITLYNGFLREDGRATIVDAMQHLQHAVNLVGVEHVGLGTDFDGDGGVPGLADASELINFTRRLLRLNFNEEEIKMIWGGNFLRVMEQVQKGAKMKR
jgi:microsomal dipeptidase-like Zn-dependent dipeptidase/gamma-glutamyl-gamma-aminobutyrate hydrolase PuuD